MNVFPMVYLIVDPPKNKHHTAICLANVEINNCKWKLWQSMCCSYFEVLSRLPNQQDLNLVWKYLFSHVRRHMLDRIAGNKPITNRTWFSSSFSFVLTKMTSWLHTCIPVKQDLIHHCPQAQNTTTEKRSINKLFCCH
jgi:hypothetical protein